MISKASIKSKLEWVDKNIDNIIHYDNGILIGKAKDKLLFLSFCMVFKRFYDFYTNENSLDFHTYLPIQLDATCNGFQYMALLSNEETLFKELNIITNKKGKTKEISCIPPNDFYNFLLHKLMTLFKNKMDKGEIIENKSNGSYERLSNFISSRTHIKKSIMTIPYNSTHRSMKRYLADTLIILDRKDDNTTWYSTSENNSKMINDRSLFIDFLSSIYN